MRDSQLVNDAAILGEVQPLEAARSRQARQNHDRSSRFDLARQSRARSVDFIRERYRVTIHRGLIQFDTLEGEMAGQISAYELRGKLSFDVFKLEQYEGQHAGVGTMLIYWLMKYGSAGRDQVQIAAFESGRGDVQRLIAWYLKHGFDAGMAGYVGEIQNACEFEIRKHMK